jgi:hypothetical protein
MSDLEHTLMFYRCPFCFQGDADSGIDRLWQKKKTELKQ